MRPLRLAEMTEQDIKGPMGSGRVKRNYEILLLLMEMDSKKFIEATTRTSVFSREKKRHFKMDTCTGLHSPHPKLSNLSM